MDREEIKKLNLRSWEYANRKFNERKGDYASAIENGTDVLPAEILKKLDPRPEDSVLHLLCNDGREAAYISWSYDSTVCGVDFSKNAIGYARRLNNRLNLQNKFYQSDIYDWLEEDKGINFDKVFLSLGSIRWIYNLKYLLDLVRDHVHNDGVILVWDFHPVIGCIDDDLVWVKEYPSKKISFLRDEGVKDYTFSEDIYTLPERKESEEKFENENSVVFTRYSIAGIMDAGLKAGYVIDAFEEYQFCWEEGYFSWLNESSPRRYTIPNSHPEIPLTFAIRLVV
jgi:SAM-dependent methyltransferase